MNSGVSTSSGLLKPEELVEGLEEGGLNGSREWPNRLSGKAGLVGSDWWR